MTVELSKELQEQNTFLDRMEAEGMKITKSWNSIWDESIRYFYGDQLGHRRAKKGWDWIVVNYILPAAMQEIAKLSKNHAQILAHPWEASDAEFAEAWRSLLQWLWEKGINGHGMRLEQIASTLDKKLYGYSVSKVMWESRDSWDDQKKQWSGDVKYRLWKPERFWSLGQEKIDDGPCGTVRYVEEQWAVNRWPKFKKRIKEASQTYEDVMAGGQGTIDGQTLATGGTYPSAGTGDADRGPVGNGFRALLNLILRRKKHTTKDSKVKYIKLAEFYYKDEEEKHVKENMTPEELVAAGIVIEQGGMFFDRNGQQITEWPEVLKREYDEPLYPMGRFVIRLGKDIIVNRNQKYGYKKWPFVVSPHYLLPHMWQGWDAVQMYKSAQDMINISVSHLVNNMKMYGDPKVAVERGAIDSPPGKRGAHFKIGKGAGSIIRLVKGGLARFKILDPPAPSAAALQLYSLFAQEFKNIVGLQDIAQGKKTEGKTTATESHFLMISANDRLALQSAYEDIWVTEIARLIAWICQKNYEVGRIVRVIGEDNVVGAQQISEKTKSVDFDIDIIPGAQLPFDQEKREAKYLQAYKLMADPTPNPMLPEVLRVMEITNWRKILEQHGMWQKFMQFLSLFNAVKEQKITPEQGIQLLIKAAMDEFQRGQDSIEGIEARNKEKEQMDQEREQLTAKGESEGRKKERAIQSERDKVRNEKESKKEKK
jgi:hypothetical protein